MKRSEFIKTTSLATSSLMLGGIPVSSMANNELLKMLAYKTQSNGKVLVIIQMNGGNDGLNTVIPLDKYPELTSARPGILIPQNRVLALNGTNTTGLHPALAEIRNMYNNQLVNIVEGVSYPNPSFSHFRAADIWFTGSAANETLNTGWLGRQLNTEFPGFPTNYPNTDMPDPLAVQIGSQVSVMTQGPLLNMAMSVTDPTEFYNLINGIADPAPNTPYGHELTFIRLIKQQTNNYSIAIKNAYNSSAASSALYPRGNYLADQLEIVARLIHGGLKSPVYVVNHPYQFDTHSNQVDGADTTKGMHADALGILSKAVNAFQEDLRLKGIQDRVTGMTFTEFGRRIISNASFGTDHGTAVPIFFFGSQLNPAIVGHSPNIPANVNESDNLAMQFDFRSVYYTILQDWFEFTPQEISSVLNNTYDVLPIFKMASPLPVTLLSFTGKWAGEKTELNWMVEQEENIHFYNIERSLNGSDFQKIGSVSGTNQPGRHTYTYFDENLSASLYYYRLQIVELDSKAKFSEVVILKKSTSPQSVRVKVLPNPVVNTFRISFESEINGLIVARLFDTGGREVWKNDQEVSNTMNIDYDISHKNLPTGIYTLQVINKNEEARLKVLINH